MGWCAVATCQPLLEPTVVNVAFVNPRACQKSPSKLEDIYDEETLVFEGYKDVPGFSAIFKQQRNIATVQ
jgi:hypothetical protein